MAISTPPPAPQRGDRSTFSTRMDAFLIWLVGLPAQLNTFLSSITTLAAGGANTFSYTFDSATEDTDPGAGKLRLGSTTQNGSVVIRLDNMAASGGDVTAFLAALQAGTSNIKGSVRLQRVNDASVWMLFDITSIATVPTYSNLTVVPRASSSASPFAANDTLVVFFDQKGDRGDGGNTPTQDEMRAAIGTLGIENGGTGATTAATARSNLGAKAAGVEPISSGGTGATTAAAALANLGGMPRAGGAFGGRVLFPSGSQGAPSIAFDSDGAYDTGFYHISDGVVGVVCNNVLVGRFTPAGLEVLKITQTQ